MKHKAKVKLAKSMRTREDKAHKRPPFQTEAWFNRKLAIKKRNEKTK